MAIMIPEKPRNFDPASQEGLIFDALALLSEDYYVFHSFRITDTREGVFHESETDFVILNRTKGVICLEAKAGQIRYENGCWLYGSGIPMHNGGPFNQAGANKYKLMRYISDSSMAFVLEKCKFFHAVWFPSVSNDRLRSMTLPSEADKTLILTKEALSDPEEFIDRVYALELPSRVETNLSEFECKRLVREIFCPQFNVFPSASFEADLKKIVFHRLLDEQAGILDFLDEQLTAAVNGAAGTGKTMIAVEKARRHAASGENVLFLCFNTQLKDYLENNYARELVSYYTIAGFACKICNTARPDYKGLKSKLEDYRNKYLFTTCRKFKGLEADVIILLDVDKTTFDRDNVLLFYVGASRARIKLEITAVLSDEDCKDILSSVLNYQGKIRRAKKDLAGALNAIGSLNS